MASLTVTDRFKYDVFLSFRGEDTRYGFTGNLWKTLDDKGVRTFIDDGELQKGDDITPSLLKAIEDSNMAIVVLSENYAYSSFCLQELSHILDSINDRGRCVHPVFYKVDPSDVRKLRNSYGKAMARHEGRCCWPVSNPNVDKWKASLHEVANLSGSHYKGDEYEHDFIKKIVDQILRNTKPIVLHAGDYLVGLEHQKQYLTSLLNIGSDDTIHMVGIHGIGGIGKTTLALEVYNSIVHQFQCSCFLEKVRENFDKNGLIYLQKILLSQIVGERNMEITSVGQGISILQKILPHKKVLLLLDDVDKDEQLKAIAGSSDWFGLGSRVIITTRDKRLLTYHGVEKIYEVKGLNDEDAFDLVGWKALKNNYSPIYKDVLLEQKHGRELNVDELRRLRDLKNDKDFSDYANVLKRVVAYASGLPLALEIIGSHLFNKTIKQCKDALDRYERVPDKKIQRTLALSFDALEKEDQFVFLDIACCLKGCNLTRVEEILHAHYGDNMKHHINVLAEKSLITISKFGVVTLHDLIEDMGKEIVRQESPQDPGERTRLWAYEDLKKVFKEDTGTSKIEIIHFQLDRSIEEKSEDWDGKAFKKMKNLKTLIFSSHVCFSETFEHIPNSLRVLEYRNRSYRNRYRASTPFDSLRVLEYRNRRYRNRYRNRNRYRASTPFECDNFLTKKFENMRVLNYDCNPLLTRMPDISNLPNLEQFSIQHCPSLNTIDESVPPLNSASLVELNLSHCHSLESFPPVVSGFLGELKILRVIGCNKIRLIPSLVLPSLEELNLSGCTNLEGFSHMVDGFGDKLKTMSVRGCNNLMSIPPLKLDSLETLDLSDCYKLESFPSVVDRFLGKLKTLFVRNCHNLRSIPPLKLDSLETLDLSYCYKLESFPSVVDRFLGKLKTLLVTNCHNLRSIPPLKLDSLETLVLSDCHSLESFPLVVDEYLGKLKTMLVTNCLNLGSIPPLKLDSLETLELSGCDTLKSFPLVVNTFLGKLKTMLVKNCRNLRRIPPLNLDSLETLELSDCHSLESFPLVVDEYLGKLKTLVVTKCRSLRSIPPLKLDSLETLELSCCDTLDSFPLVVDTFLAKLKTLKVKSCCNIRIIPPLKLDSLETLELSDCHSLESFPLVVDEYLGKLKTVVVTKCRSLRSIPPLKLDSLEKLELSCCDTLDSFPLVVAKLKTLKVKSCCNIRIIPPLKLDSLETLELSDCHSLESFPLVVDEYLGKLKTMLVTSCVSLKSIPPLKLDSLETLELSDCHSLESFPLVVDEYLGKLKTMLVTNCFSLRSIPPLKLDSLETLDLSCCYSLENFPLVVDGFLGKLKTMLVKNCHNLRSIPPLKLDLLQELDLSNCFMLESFSSVRDELLDKLKFVNIEFCIMLKSMPQLSLTSLKNINLSCCYSLESFPEILGEMRNIPGLLLDDTPSIESPFPFHNLTQPPSFHPCDCQYDNRSDGNHPKLTIMNEEKVNAMQSSNVKYICVRNAKLSDELLSKTLMLFANVKELHLTNNQLTIIPKSIEKCQFLWNLVLDDCEELNEIKGIPPCLRELSALNCKSLSSSCKSKLLNQKLHEAGNTRFRLPRAKIPEWFDHQYEPGMSISFWFCGKFPAIALCVVSPHTWSYSYHPVKVIINGITFFNTLGWKTVNRPRTYHLHLLHMQVENFNDNMDKALLENKWNHAEVDFGFPFMYSGIHVLKEKSNMKDIQFINPENDANVVFTRDEAMLPEPFNLSTELSSTFDEIEPLPNNLPLSSSSKRHFS